MNILRQALSRAGQSLFAHGKVVAGEGSQSGGKFFATFLGGREWFGLSRCHQVGIGGKASRGGLRTMRAQAGLPMGTAG